MAKKKRKVDNEDDETPAIQRTLDKSDIEKGVIVEGWGRGESEIPEVDWNKQQHLDVDEE